MKVWLPCTHRVSPSARAESQIRAREEKASVASGSLRSSHTRCRLPSLGPAVEACVPCAVIPQATSLFFRPPPPATPWKFPRSQVSRILDWDLRVPSMPSRQPVGPVTAMASLFQRTSLTSHLGSRATQKVRPVFHGASVLRVSCLRPRSTSHTDRTSTIFNPVGKLPTIMRPREPRPIPTPESPALRGRALDRTTGRSTDATRRSEETTELAQLTQQPGTVQPPSRQA